VNVQPSIYQIALEEPAGSLAARLRVVIAKVAVEDPNWCRTYEALIEALGEGGLRHPEMFTVENGTTYNGPVLLREPAGDPEEVAATVVAQARNLGAPHVGAAEVDLVAAVVAAECWMAALDAENLAYAAAKGPDAIASAAAILARACGEGVPVMPADPDWPSLKFPMEKLLRAAARGRAWSDWALGEAAWGEVVGRVVTDLGYMAGGGTKTHEASLLLGVRMSEITPAH